MRRGTEERIIFERLERESPEKPGNALSGSLVALRTVVDEHRNDEERNVRDHEHGNDPRRPLPLRGFEVVRSRRCSVRSREVLSVLRSSSSALHIVVVRHLDLDRFSSFWLAFFVRGDLVRWNAMKSKKGDVIGPWGVWLIRIKYATEACGSYGNALFLFPDSRVFECSVKKRFLNGRKWPA